MYALEIPARNVDDIARLLRALGTHRYVRSRLHLVHAFALDAAATVSPELADAAAWARGALEDREIDISSRDERLLRPSSEADVAAVLSAFWRPGEAAVRARARLEEWLQRAELPIADTVPFDESAEEDIHPLLVDVGWELLPLAELDPERHKGVIGAFGEPIDFEVARFDEESAVPELVYLHELPGMGPVELLRGVDANGDLAQPLPLWASGHETYHDYLVRGVCRAAKLVMAD